MAFRLIILTLLATLAALAPARAEWGGSISQNVGTVTQQALESRSLDQQYYLYTTAQPTDALHYSLSGLFRHLQNNSAGGPYTWRTEVSPAGAFQLASRFLVLRGDASYRADRDETGLAELTGQSTTLRAQTSVPKWPQWFATANWARNVNNLDLIGFDTKSRTLATGANYYSDHLTTHYEFSDSRIQNQDTGVDRLAQNHRGRAELTTSLSKSLLGWQLNYQIDSRSDQDLSLSQVQTLVLLTATGLYKNDPSPDFDPLEPAPGLSDGLLDIPASTDYNLVNGSYHCFGLDFGIPVESNNLHLYLDSLAVGAPLWSIWTSDDNLNWTSIAQNYSAAFTPLFNRYEFSFNAVTARYIKLAISPLLVNAPVEVTELRAYISTVSQAKNKATDHRASARMNLRPAKWLHAEVGGDALRQDLSQTALAREEDGFNSALRVVPAKPLDFSIRYQWSRRQYSHSERPEGATSSISGILRSIWSRPITTQTTVERREETLGSSLIRRSNSARLDLNLVIFPALRSATQFAYSQDERFDSPDRYFARSVGQFFDGQPTPRSQLSVGYRYESHSADVAAVLKYRYSVDARAIYRLTDAVILNSGGSLSEDPGRNDRSYSASVLWSPTNKLSLTGAMNRLEGSLAQNETQYISQATFRWTMRTEISASYSLNSIEGGQIVAASRLSIFARF